MTTPRAKADTKLKTMQDAFDDCPIGHGNEQWIGFVAGWNAASRLSRPAAPPVPRCPICDWPLAPSAKEGCVPGNCSYRPDPQSPEGQRIAERRKQLSTPPAASQVEALREKVRAIPKPVGMDEVQDGIWGQAMLAVLAALRGRP